MKYLQKAGELGICFIATTIITRFKGFGAIDGLFKATQTGLVLGNPGETSTLFPAVRVASTYRPSPEIGFWTKRGDAKKIKLPFVE